MDDNGHMTPQELIKQITGLVSLPDVCLQVYQQLEDPFFSATQVTQTISLDPGLTARVLRMVNSAYFGLTREVDTIPHALGLLGADRLRNLVLSTSVTSAFRSIPSDLVDMELFWTHSVTTALLAQHLAKACLLENPERMFVTGLLHDIGQLVIYSQKPELATQTLERSIDDEHHLWELEQQIIGCDHAAVGGALIDSWKLPESLCEPVTYHHQPAKAENFPQEAAIAHIANVLANTEHPSRHHKRIILPPIEAIDPWALEQVSIDETMMEEALQIAQEEYAEVTSMVLNA